MARSKAFDRAQALEQAMRLFWVRGYEATSLDELLAAMGIGRQSLYDTFGDKRTLFLEALRHYKGLTDDFVRSCLAGSPTVKAGIRRLFQQVVDEPHDHKRRGCLLVNTAVELAPHDAEAARLIAANQRTAERLFRRALELARERGELPPGRDVGRLARYLVAALQGLRVAAKADPRPAALRDVVDVALSVLD